MEMTSLAPKYTKLHLFDDMDHYKFFVLKNLVEPILDYLTQLYPVKNVENLHASIMVMKDRIEMETIPQLSSKSLTLPAQTRTVIDEQNYRSTREATDNEITMTMHRRADDYKSTFLNPGEKFKID